MLLSLLVLGAALAQDTGDTGDTGALQVPEGTVLTFPDATAHEAASPSLLALRQPPSLAEGVNMVPGGSVILLRQEDGTFVVRGVPAKAFLLPGPMYDSALIKAKQLAICQPALDLITEETLRMADRTYKALTTCDGQFDVDAEAISKLEKIGRDQEIRAIVAEDGQKRARKGQAVAWAITGGVVLGATAATAITLGTL